MPTAPGYADCSYELSQTGLSRPSYITFGVDSTDTDPLIVAGQVQGAWSAAGSLNTIIDNTVTMTGVRVSLGTDGGADNVAVLTTSVAGGGGAMTSLPPNCAVLIHKRTARGGRRGRGRMYIPWCVLEGNVDEAGIITSANVTTITTAFTAWRTALATSGNPLVLLHGKGKSTIPAPDLVTSAACDRLISTQRRRLGRR